MRKSVVLKDLNNRIAGYVHICRAGILCRMNLNSAAQMIVMFSDGSQKEYTVEGGNREQHFDEESRTMSGCYVFREDQLLLISDETMRSAFEKRRIDYINADKALEAPMQQHTEVQQKNVKDQERNQEQNKRICNEEFPQRRWPPHACWEEARYCQGRWEEG